MFHPVLSATQHHHEVLAPSSIHATIIIKAATLLTITSTIYSTALKLCVIIELFGYVCVIQYFPDTTLTQQL
jgi:hypothetical protein